MVLTIVTGYVGGTEKKFFNYIPYYPWVKSPWVASHEILSSNLCCARD